VNCDCECDDDMTEDGHGSGCPNGVTHLREEVERLNRGLDFETSEHKRTRVRVSELEAALWGLLLRDEMGCACDEPERGPCEWHRLTDEARKALEAKP